MFIDYLTVMLLNMVAGLVLLGAYLVWGLRKPEDKWWAPAFGAVALVALATGLHMSLTWPLTGGAAWANIAFGEPTVMLGAAFAAAAVCIAKGWSLKGVGIYAVVGGVVSITIGIVIGSLGLTKKPAISTIGFLATGIGAIATAVCIFLPRSLLLRMATAMVLAIAAVVWTITGLGAFASHIKRFSGG